MWEDGVVIAAVKVTTKHVIIYLRSSRSDWSFYIFRLHQDLELKSTS